MYTQFLLTVINFTAVFLCKQCDLYSFIVLSRTTIVINYKQYLKLLHHQKKHQNMQVSITIIMIPVHLKLLVLHQRSYKCPGDGDKCNKTRNYQSYQLIIAIEFSITEFLQFRDSPYCRVTYWSHHHREMNQQCLPESRTR